MPKKPKETVWPVFDLTHYDVNPDAAEAPKCQSHVMSGMHCTRPAVPGEILCASHLAMAGDLSAEVPAET